MSPITELLNSAMRLALEVDPDAGSRLRALRGRVLCVQLTAPSLTFYVVPGQDGVDVVDEYDGEPDVTLRGGALAFARLVTGGVDSGVMSRGQVTMQGDAEAGRLFQHWLAGIDFDWEEILARGIGDTAARKAGNLARGVRGWAEESAHLSRRNMGEYLQEEKRILPSALAMQRFEDGVTALRADVDRLEQRLEKLRKPAGRA